METWTESILHQKRVYASHIQESEDLKTPKIVTSFVPTGTIFAV